MQCDRLQVGQSRLPRPLQCSPVLADKSGRGGGLAGWAAAGGGSNQNRARTETRSEIASTWWREPGTGCMDRRACTTGVEAQTGGRGECAGRGETGAGPQPPPTAPTDGRTTLQPESSWVRRSTRTHHIFRLIRNIDRRHLFAL